MPRADGFATNQELLADFTSSARDVLLTSYQKEFGGFHPAFLDKPVTSLVLQVFRGYFGGLRDGTMSSESVEITILDPDEVEMFPSNLRMRSLPPETVGHYATMAARLQETTFDEELDLGMAVPAGAVIATYTARFVGKGNVKRVGTYSEKPAKQNIVSGRAFLDDAAHYVASDDFDVPIEERLGLLRAQRRLAGVDVFTHGFSFKLIPELPLNGHEPPSFLTRYRDEMALRADAAVRQIQRIDGLPAEERASGPFVDQVKEQSEEAYEICSMAGLRAQVILDGLQEDL